MLTEKQGFALLYSPSAGVKACVSEIEISRNARLHLAKTDSATGSTVENACRGGRCGAPELGSHSGFFVIRCRERKQGAARPDSADNGKPPRRADGERGILVLVYAPTGFVNQAQLAQSVDAAIRSLNPQEVVHVAYSIGNDSTDDPAIFFRTVLTDAASSEDRLDDVTGRVTSTLFRSIRPLENWGLMPYFSFRSLSEQRMRNDPEWS